MRSMPTAAQACRKRGMTKGLDVGAMSLRAGAHGPDPAAGTVGRGERGEKGRERRWRESGAGMPQPGVRQTTVRDRWFAADV